MTATAQAGSENCAACGRPLTDAISIETKLGPDCRALYNYISISKLDDADRTQANKLIHAIAADSLYGTELRDAIFALHTFGLDQLAKRIERRVHRRLTVTVEEKRTEPEIPTAPKPVELPFTLTEGQERARQAVHRIMAKRAFGMCVIAGYAGTGKAQPYTSTVYTPSGPKRMGDMAVGDVVCTPAGGRAVVAGVFPQGRRKVWKFVLEDGAQVESCEDHLWVVKDRTRSSNLGKYKTDTRKLTTKYIVQRVQSNAQGHARFYLRQPRPLDFDSQQLPVDPYLLGLLLGNGSIGPADLSISSGSSGDLIRVVEDLVRPLGCRIMAYPLSNSYRIRGAGRRDEGKLPDALQGLGLWGTESHTKFVPAGYLLGSVEQRRAVLQGIMDTDGTVDKRSGAPSLSTASPQLASDVVWLVRSLGGRATISAKAKPRYKYKGEIKIGRPAHIVHISMDDTHTLFRLDHKRIRTRPRAHEVNRAIRSVEYMGEQSVQCILVDDPEHMYITDGFVPTHNTTAMRVFGAEYGYPQIITPTGKAALRVNEATGLEASTIHRWIYAPKEDPRTGITTFQRRALDEIAIPASRLVLMDESSMVGPDVWKDVYEVCKALELRLVVVGDAFQLPPVLPRNAPPFSLLSPEFANVHRAERIEMTEVLRQAQDSPVIRASMRLRAGMGMSALDELPKAPLEWLAQITTSTHAQGGVTICHRNSTRFLLNANIRAALGIYDEQPQIGEPLMCLKNNYEAGVLNGESFKFEGWQITPENFERVHDRYNDVSEDTRFGATRVQNAQVVISLEELHGRLKSSPRAIEITGGKWARLNNLAAGDTLAPTIHVNFGYAWTAHKMQGSECPFVLIVLEPTIRLNEDDGRRWMYTAVTRATKQAAIYAGRI